MPAGTIHQPTTIVDETGLEMAPSSRIDAYCLVNANGGVTLHEESVIHAGSHVIGSGHFEMGPRAVVTYNCVVLTTTADLRYPASTVVPEAERRDIVADVTLMPESFVGSGAVLMPGVTLHEGAVVAANAFVDDDVPAWTIRFPDGTERPRETAADAF